MKHFLPSCNHKIYSYQKEESGNFIVKNISTNVDILNGTCSCMMGVTGKVCMHSSFVITNIGDDIETAFNVATKKTRELMLYIATDIKLHKLV